MNVWELGVEKKRKKTLDSLPSFPLSSHSVRSLLPPNGENDVHATHLARSPRRRRMRLGLGKCSTEIRIFLCRLITIFGKNVISVWPIVSGKKAEYQLFRLVLYWPISGKTGFFGR